MEVTHEWVEGEEEVVINQYSVLRAFYAKSSKITKQRWLLLKSGYSLKASQALYHSQPLPLLKGITDVS